MDLPETKSSDRTRRGLLIVLSSPSGAGKSTLSRMLMEADREITMSVSATTRPLRNGEREGIDYHFVDDREFQGMVDADELAEWAYVFDHRYGSPKEPIKEALRSGRDILFDIDWQGTQQLKYAFGNDLVPIFILPPEDLVIGLSLMVLMGLLAGVMPAMGAMRLKITDALRRN